MRHLRKRLDGIKVVDRIPDDTDRIFFGAWVHLADSRDKDYLYRIVGPDEFDPKLGYISMDSPMGKALLGKSLDDEFKLVLSDGETSYTVLAVSYTPISL